MTEDEYIRVQTMKRIHDENNKDTRSSYEIEVERQIRYNLIGHALMFEYKLPEKLLIQDPIIQVCVNMYCIDNKMSLTECIGKIIMGLLQNKEDLTQILLGKSYGR